MINAGNYPIYIGNEVVGELNRFISKENYSSIFVLVDENTKKYCLNKIRKDVVLLQKAKIISIRSGEKNKNIASCIKIWAEISKHHAEKKSLLINLGGGVITDIGGFAASTYKRGIDCIHLPTSLLAQTDAAIGGKTGIDFSGIKNHIGTFSFPKAVFILPALLKTLNRRQLLSGFAETIKHALIDDKSLWTYLSRTSGTLPFEDEQMITKSIQIKNKIVESDPYEKGARKILNFGHTIGHAVESASLKTKKPLLHGEAVAMGMICEAYLSRKCCGLSTEELDNITSFILSVFSPKPIKLPVKQLMGFMKQDKKNRDTEINFTLLSSIGKAEINNFCSEELIEEAIGYYKGKA